MLQSESEQACCSIFTGLSLGADLQVEGWENVPAEDTPAVYCANHESYMVRSSIDCYTRTLAEISDHLQESRQLSSGWPERHTMGLSRQQHCCKPCFCAYAV